MDHRKGDNMEGDGRNLKRHTSLLSDNLVVTFVRGVLPPLETCPDRVIVHIGVSLMSVGIFDDGNALREVLRYQLFNYFSWGVPCSRFASVALRSLLSFHHNDTSVFHQTTAVTHGCNSYRCVSLSTCHPRNMCSIAASLGMLHPDHMSAEGLPMTVRTVYVISPEKILKLALTYPASTGRNFDEVCFVVAFVLEGGLNYDTAGLAWLLERRVEVMGWKGRRGAHIVRWHMIGGVGSFCDKTFFWGMKESCSFPGRLKTCFLSSDRLPGPRER